MFEPYSNVVVHVSFRFQFVVVKPLVSWSGLSLSYVVVVPPWVRFMVWFQFVVINGVVVVVQAMLLLFKHFSLFYRVVLVLQSFILVLPSCPSITISYTSFTIFSLFYRVILVL